MRYLLAGILYGVVYLGSGVLLGGHPSARSLVANVLLASLAASVCAVIAWRRREWEGSQRLFWDAFAAGMAMWTVGETGFTMDSLVFDRPSWVQWHTMFSLCGGIGPMIALIARPHRGVRKAATPAIGIDLISYALVAGFIYAYFVLVPSVVPVNGTNPEATLFRLVQVHRFVLVAGMLTAFWVARGTAWRSTYGRLAIGVVFGFFLRMVTSAAITRGDYYPGSFYDLAWIVPFLCYVWAALEAPASPRGGDGADEISVGWRSPLVSAIPVFMIPILGYGLLHVQPIGDPGDSFRVLLTTLTTVAGLGLLTLRLSVQGSELQRADQQLKLLAAATEQTGDLILITKPNGAFEHANDACVRALGYSRRELSGLRLHDLLERGFERTLTHIPREIRDKGIWRGTLLHRRRDGSVFPVSTTVVALKDTDGRVVHYVGVERDITEELRLRDQLVHSERLSAVGELVAGVAHEINNPLQTIVGCVELLLEERKGDPNQVRDLQLVRQEAARAGQIVRNLLAFVRRGAADRNSTDLNHIVKATADLREYHLTQQNITLLLDLHPEPLPVLANREEIQQVVLNLIMNAEQAIASGAGAGTILLKTRSADGMHMLQVIDDGPGIPKELRGKIFEPFFTTKDVGQGTGLGLSISLGIATSHGGLLELGDAGKGASLKLTLPACGPAPARDVSAPAPVEAEVDAAEQLRALVIDDERAIRELLARLLQRRGFTVAQASTAAAGRELLRQRFHVVLCDLQLGDGSGIDCYRWMREVGHAAPARFVFITGDDGVLERYPDVANAAVLAKPFTASDLDRVLALVQVGV